MAISFIDFVYDDAGDAVVGATVELFDRNTTTPVRATTTTDSAGKFSISHATEGRFDVQITNGSSVRRLKYDVSYQSEAAELALLNLRNPGETFKYVVTPGAITAERILNLPVLTQTAAVYVTPAIEDLNLDGNNIDNGGVIYLKEQAEADADVAGSGQIWVNTATPNELYFTDDAGTDVQLNVAVPTQANQAALEAETNENTYAPPDLIKHSPGVAKGWVSFTGATPAINASYNVSSVTDTGTGDFAVNWNTDFSGSHYAVVLGGRVGSNNNDNMNVDDPPTAGVTSVITTTQDATPVDVALAFVAAFGDQ